MAELKKAFFYGDSNTYGYDPAGFMGGRYPREERWTTILQDNLAQTWEVLADGMPGRSLPSVGYEWDYLRSVLREVTPLDLFAVMLGSNDILGTLRPNAEKTAAKMNDFVSFVTDFTGEATQFLLIAPPRIELREESYSASYVRGDKSYAQIYFEQGEKLAEYYEDLAGYRGILFADASKWELDFAYDGVHLSERGHALFAQKMTEVLRTIGAE
jgi:lysophospholipase L1-like esterase